MLYAKNVPKIERVLRVALGSLLIGLTLFGQSLIGELTIVQAGILLFSALFVVVTGFVGWCPACAMIGRKIKADMHAKAHEK